MADSAAFFDTSAVVPLIVAQPTSQQARKAYRRFARQVVAWTASVEAAGAIYQSIRLGALRESNARRALARLSQLEKRWIEILATDRIRHSAISLLEIYDLRSADAIQLASALVWSNDKPRNRSFVCFDRKLNEAASAAGFSVVESVR